MQADRIQMLKKMLEQEPNDEFLNYALALEYHKLNKTQDAISLLNKVIAINPTYHTAYYQLGKICEEQDNVPGAVSQYLLGREEAKKQNDLKAYGEFNEALMMLDYEE